MVIDSNGEFVRDVEASKERGIHIFKQQRHVEFLPTRFRGITTAEFFDLSGLSAEFESILEESHRHRLPLNDDDIATLLA